ncbi:MAG: hypothetical protein KJN99_12290 [Marinicaulis sp.]|nr:hypothetical protein [Marinicaulis sp.]
MRCFLYYRWIVGFPLTAVVAAGLCAMMAFMIGYLVVETNSVREPPNLYILANLTDKPIDDTPKFVRPNKNPPPDIEPLATTRSEQPRSNNIDIDPIDNTTKIEIDTVAFRKPAIQHAPQYPETYRSRGATKIVLVQLDAIPDGNVIKPIILESADRLFQQNADCHDFQVEISTCLSIWSRCHEARAG